MFVKKVTTFFKRLSCTPSQHRVRRGVQFEWRLFRRLFAAAVAAAAAAAVAAAAADQTFDCRLVF